MRRHRWVWLCLLLLAVTGVVYSSVAPAVGMAHPSAAAAAWHGEDMSDSAPTPSLPVTARLPLPHRTASTALPHWQPVAGGKRLLTAIFHPPKAA